MRVHTRQYPDTNYPYLKVCYFESLNEVQYFKSGNLFKDFCNCVGVCKPKVKNKE